MKTGHLLNNRTVLLGAGFSKNFGGFLASEVREILLADKNIMSNYGLRQMLTMEKSYESVVQTMREHNADHPNRAILETAVLRPFKIVEEPLRDLLFDVFSATFTPLKTVR
jgi:hypothetical protein